MPRSSVSLLPDGEILASHGNLPAVLFSGRQVSHIIVGAKLDNQPAKSPTGSACIHGEQERLHHQTGKTLESLEPLSEIIAGTLLFST